MSEPVYDEFRRIVEDSKEIWVKVCRCRCDDNDTVHVKNDNGEDYVPKYHIVCEGKADIKAGELVRCMSGDEVRGEGKVVKVKTLNYLPFFELWV